MFSLRTNFSLIVTVTKVHLPTRLVWFLWEVKWERNDTSISFCREKPLAVFDNNWSIGNRHLTEGGVIETVEVIETNPFSFHFLLCHSSPTLFLWIYFDLNEKWGKPCDFLKWTEPTQIDWTKIQSGYQDLFLGTLAVRFTFWIYSIFLLFLFQIYVDFRKIYENHCLITFEYFDLEIWFLKKSKSWPRCVLIW